jgi:hypothetical protein
MKKVKVLRGFLFKYRSVLAPIYMVFYVFAAGIILHVFDRQYWALPILVAGIGSLPLIFVLHEIRKVPMQVCAYFSVLVFSTGTWLTIAARNSPFHWGIVWSVIITTLILGSLWWWHRRIHTRVRIERRLSRWKDVAKDVGLPASKQRLTRLTPYGYELKGTLARGQTIALAQSKTREMESAYGLPHGSLSIYPHPNGRAHKYQGIVMDKDPLEKPIPWKNPTIASVKHPVTLGLFQDGNPVKVLLPGKHMLIGGMTGYGKSGLIGVIMANLSYCPDALIWGIDLKGGVSFGPWNRCLSRLGTTPEVALKILKNVETMTGTRAAHLGKSGQSNWNISASNPAIFLIIDEFEELIRQVPGADKLMASITNMGRSSAVTVIASTQRPAQKAMGDGSVRSQMPTRICFKVADRINTDMVLGDGKFKSGWDATLLDVPGKFLIHSEENPNNIRARAFFIDDNRGEEIALSHSFISKHLDALTQASISSVRRPEAVQAITPEPSNYFKVETKYDKLLTILDGAPEEGIKTADLMKMAGINKIAFHRRMNKLEADGVVVNAAYGRWRKT